MPPAPMMAIGMRARIAWFDMLSFACPQTWIILNPPTFYRSSENMTATSVRAGAGLRRMARLVRDDAAKWGRVIREAGVKVE